ncbi:putative nitric oxide synthase isoform X1 [Coffea arabica]|uniref:Nitric oxide synthase isoform X1 n=1 Tax=Coffea arabica TaxID=13443 RepID=A0A6P6W6A1_COFAR|nr:putative nitric oxide synthase [Coffea arabica]
MAPKPLPISSSSSPLSTSLFPFRHHLVVNPNPSLLKFPPPKPTFFVTICKFGMESQFQTRRQEPNPSSSQMHNYPDTEPEPHGSGAAAPTRGERFLERHQSLSASTMLLPESKKKKKKKKDKDKVSKVSSVLPSCYGCGAPLQTSETDAPGYVDPDTYELKKKHRQLRTVLCGRCRLLSHGHMITAVGGNGGYSGGEQFISAEELREKLSHLRNEKALIIKLVDIADFNGSFVARVRDLTGANPIILVVTKVDLLPKGTDLNCVGDWVVEATVKKKLNVLSVHLTSSKSLVGIAGVVSEIQKEKKGRDVYILGSANVGKSAFINALLRMLSYKDPVAAAARKYKPIQSAVPGTTLGPIQIDAFLGGGKLYDTPGVHLHHRQAAVVHAEDLPSLAPQSQLRGQTLPSISNPVGSNDLNGFSIFWGGLVRIDVIKVLPETCLTFYGPKALKLHIVATEEADEFYRKEVGGLLIPPSGKQKANDWMGLETRRELQIEHEDVNRPACDVAISGLGWISVEPFNKSLSTADKVVEKIGEQLVLAVHVPKPVEIFVRSPIPVGKAGAGWYEFRELTEKEEGLRPKWYF